MKQQHSIKSTLIRTISLLNKRTQIQTTVLCRTLTLALARLSCLLLTAIFMNLLFMLFLFHFFYK